VRIPFVASLPTRKTDHLTIAASPGVLHTVTTGLEDVRLRHRALPGRDLDQVDLTTALLGAHLAAPLLVSAMTGGTDEAGVINRRLAEAAAEHGLAMALGSGRILLDDPSLLPTFRSGPRPPLLLANLGAAGLTVDAAEELVELLRADGLTIHLNAIQEAVQPEGSPDFADAGERIAAVAAALAPLPVVVKEVGFGMDAEDVRELDRSGVAAIDVAGAGGTNWATIEGRRDDRAGAVAAAFDGWGVPTADALAQATAATVLPVIASGGVGDGVDAAKCLALGAAAVGVARPLLTAALADRADVAAEVLVEQLRIAVWACGAPSADAMDRSRLAR
jgi:isopentenyl-diphosphate delta-isomerase